MSTRWSSSWEQAGSRRLSLGGRLLLLGLLLLLGGAHPGESDAEREESRQQNGAVTPHMPSPPAGGPASARAAGLSAGGAPAPGAAAVLSVTGSGSL